MKASLVCIVCFCAVAAMAKPQFGNVAGFLTQAAGNIAGAAGLGAGAGGSLGLEVESPFGKVGLHKEAHIGAGGNVAAQAQAQGAAGAQGASVPVAPVPVTGGLPVPVNGGLPVPVNGGLPVGLPGLTG